MNLRAPELLAPAGGPAALRAAVANGADAVYLGVDRFNARQGAENFTLETLGEACRFAHLRGVSVYLTLNVVLLPGELAEALRVVDHAWAAGIDAVIVQDLGLLRLLARQLPHVRVHASTQIDAHSTETVQALADMGVERVTLARETSLEQIARIVAQSDVEIETFVHGALCVCYSGQCLLSSLIGGRSANRGACAQPCRLTYELEDAAGKAADVPGAHLLSPKDLAGITQLPALARAGVASLKIEGRMKSPEYVALVTGVYRAALDRALADAGGYEVRDGELAVLNEAFSRGFTEGYLVGERGNEMMSYRRPNNRGVPVGRLAAVSGDRATIALDSPLDSQDTIEIWTSSGRFAQRVGPLVVSGTEHPVAPAGSRSEFRIDGAASAGDRVFRVNNAALSRAAQRTFSDAAGSAPIELDIAVRLVAGEALTVTVADAQGRSGYASGAPVEPARTKSVTAEEVAEHVGRLGGTPYRVRAWDITIAPGVGAGFSALHRLRREALAAYEAQVLAPWSGRRRAEPDVPKAAAPRRRPDAVAVVAVVADVPTARACLEAGADEAVVPIWAVPEGDFASGISVGLSRVSYDDELAASVDMLPDGSRVWAATLGGLRAASSRGHVTDAHWALNACNPWSVAALADLGAARVWLSPELTGRQIAETAATAATPVGIAVYGRQEVMVTEHCILMAEGECGRNCVSCTRRRAPRYLKDRKDYRFPVVTDPTGRSHVYNSVPLDLMRAMPEVLDAGVSALRLDLEVEQPEAAAAAVRRVRAAITAARAGDLVPTATREPATSGHFFRGVG